jgi:hypothetical protein
MKVRRWLAEGAAFQIYDRISHFIENQKNFCAYFWERNLRENGPFILVKIIAATTIKAFWKYKTLYFDRLTTCAFNQTSHKSK